MIFGVQVESSYFIVSKYLIMGIFWRGQKPYFCPYDIVTQKIRG